MKYLEARTDLVIGVVDCVFPVEEPASFRCGNVEGSAAFMILSVLDSTEPVRWNLGVETEGVARECLSERLLIPLLPALLSILVPQIDGWSAKFAFAGATIF